MNIRVNGAKPQGGVPRGIAKTGPALLSYGFRPFFLLAGTWAVLSLALWMGALIYGWAPGGAYGALNWHAHELLFGYTTAVLSGFMLTAIPNWTGRLPVSGRPLAALVLLWLAGRVALCAYDFTGMWVALIIDTAFLPVVGAIAAREIIAGRNWKNLHVIAALLALTTANIWFHFSAVQGGDTGGAYRLTISIWLLLISLIGGRLAVSFTRNWLVKRGVENLPTSLGQFDKIVMLTTIAGLALWIIVPDWAVTGIVAILVGALHIARLARWRGWLVAAEPLLLVLHVAYGFIPLGFFALAGAVFGIMSPTSALHLFTVGVIGNMTLAVMTRVSRGHTGHKLSASVTTAIAYLALALSALARPMVDFLPQYYLEVLAGSGVLWILAFGIFLFEYAPMLARRRVQ